MTEPVHEITCPHCKEHIRIEFWYEYQAPKITYVSTFKSKEEQDKWHKEHPPIRI